MNNQYLSVLRASTYKHFIQITSALHEHIEQILLVRICLIHGGQSLERSMCLHISRLPHLTGLLSWLCNPNLPRREAYGHNVIEQRSLSLNQNSQAEVCPSSPPPVIHGRQFYTQPIVPNRGGPREKNTGAHLMDASPWFNLSPR